MDRRTNGSPTRARWRRPWPLLLALALPVGPAGGASAAAPSTGVRYTLRVGYQPYFAEAWSGVLVRALRLHTDHLPRGVAVEFRVGMTGGCPLGGAVRHGDVDLAFLWLAPSVSVTQGSSPG